MNKEKMLLYCLTIVLGIGLYAIFQGYIIGLNTSSWSFIGKDFIIGFLPVLPTLFLVMLIAIPVYFIVEEIR